MSATLDAGPVARFLGDCPVLERRGAGVPGRDRVPSDGSAGRSPEAIAAAVEEVLAGPDDPGDVLVFLPGAEEIRRAGARLEPLAEREDLLVLPAARVARRRGPGPGPAAERSPQGHPGDEHRRDLADDRRRHDRDRQRPGPVRQRRPRARARPARAGPDQPGVGRRSARAERAGRARGAASGSGRSASSAGWPRPTRPRSHRVDLGATVLALHAWGLADPGRFAWFEPPPQDRLDAAERLLAMLGALDARGGRLTPLGRQLLALPVHPRLGRLLLAAAARGLPARGGRAGRLALREGHRPDRGRRDRGGRVPRAGARPTSWCGSTCWPRPSAQRFAARLRDRGIDPGAARQGRQGPRRADPARPAAPGAGAIAPGEPDEETDAPLGPAGLPRPRGPAPGRARRPA